MPQQPLDLTSLAKSVQPLVNFSLNNFIPETILTVGFLVAVVMDLLIKDRKQKQLTGYFAMLVFAAAGIAALMQWIPFDPKVQGWKGGTMIFFYTQMLVQPFGMLVVDNFAVFFKLIISLTGIFVIAMSLFSHEVEVRRTKFGEYYSLLLGMAVGMFLMPASTDLIMMYISLELVSITSYILTGFMKDSPRSSEASMKYLLFGAFSSGLMLYGFSILYGLTGSTNIIAIKAVLSTIYSVPGAHPTMALWFATILSLAGMGYKISAAPFHFWTPDVYEGAPIPITALLSVASKAAGFGLLMRFLLFTFPMNPASGNPILNWPLLIAVLSALTMTLGNFAALQQSNIKRMLAYSTIAHAGYMLIGLVAAGAEVGLIGQTVTSGSAGIVSIMIYLIAYLFMNLGAFYIIMLIANKTGSEEIEDYRGLARRVPLLSVALGLFLISLTGIPLTVGFIGKLYIFTAIMRLDPVTHEIKYLWLAVFAILNSVVSLYYYIRVMAAMFIKSPEERPTISGAPMIATDGAMTFSFPSKVLIFAFLVPVLVLGVYFSPMVEFAGNVVRFFNMQ